MRVGFLFNHDQLHQVAHSLPIALALADQYPDAEVVLAPTTDRIEAEVRRLAGAALGPKLRVERLRLRHPASRAAAALLGTLLPAAKLLMLRDNLPFFRALDLLVVAEKTSLLLKRRYGLSRLPIIHTRHGAGDRAIGFDRASVGFDHILVSGEKIRDRLVSEAAVDPQRISIVGYPKFDLYARRRPVRRDTDPRPIVLYNPHPSPHLSSWFKAGRQILDWFVEHPEYRLIFAPHVMLFERPVAMSIDRLRVDFVGTLAERHRAAENIRIDLGSRASTTMEYTEAADIYFGDVSSQIYEFLLCKRPCLFFDAHRTAWRDNPDYAVWNAGPVIDDVSALGQALADTRADHEAVYEPVQQALFRYSFDLQDTPSSTRAAAAVARFAGLERQSRDARAAADA